MNIRKITAFIIVLVLGVSMVACGTSGSEDTVVAEVNGEKITKDEFDSLYDQIKQSYNITEEIENDPEQQEAIAELKADILEQIITEKLVVQKAKEAGFEVNEDILNEARREFENIIAEVAFQIEIMDSSAQENQDNEESQGKDYMSEAKAYIQEQLESIGQTEEEYIEFIAEQMVLDNYIEDLVKDVKADQQEVQQYYEERLEFQKNNISNIVYEEVELYAPEEARVKHILIMLAQEHIDEYNSLLSQEKTEEAQQYLEEKLKDIEPKALEVLEKAKGGEEFEKLIEEYGEDPGMEGNDTGYLVRQDGSFVHEFEETAFKLEEGEISDLVASGFGYHIIKLYEKTPEKVYTLEEKYDELEEILSQQKKTDAWTLILEEWMESAKIKRYEKRL
ncbi:MAG: peptidylprolyl isomerase [Clostridiales bacterium]|nr:peptidylprolyl isomerase [Clostridiales bacterium]